jgi:hypothetical protein
MATAGSVIRAAAAITIVDINLILVSSSGKKAKDPTR